MKKTKEGIYYFVIISLLAMTVYLFIQKQAEIAVTTALVAVLITVIKPVVYKFLKPLGL